MVVIVEELCNLNGMYSSQFMYNELYSFCNNDQLGKALKFKKITTITFVFLKSNSNV